MVIGAREFLTCPNCKKRFTYWLLESYPHPKVKCYYCATESFPKGEPPAAPVPAPAPPAAAAPPPSSPPPTPTA